MIYLLTADFGYWNLFINHGTQGFVLFFIIPCTSVFIYYSLYLHIVLKSMFAYDIACFFRFCISRLRSSICRLRSSEKGFCLAWSSIVQTKTNSRKEQQPFSSKLCISFFFAKTLFFSENSFFFENNMVKSLKRVVVYIFRKTENK